jgi:uncharacterized membrane protein (UPF0136 family)
VVLIVLGAVLLVAGVVMIPTAGPGIVVAIVGALLLAAGAAMMISTRRGRLPHTAGYAIGPVR